jgi:uncharacterized protein (DUF433 family)
MNGLSQGQGMGQPQVDPRMVEQVAAMLQSGVSPEELVQKGVPPEVIEAAIVMLEQQAMAQQQQGPMGAPQGLSEGMLTN